MLEVVVSANLLDVVDDISCFIHGSCTAALLPGFRHSPFQPLPPFLLLARMTRAKICDV